MRSPIISLFVVFVAIAGLVLAESKMADRPGFKDPALFTRMPNYFLNSPSSFKESQFDAYEFRVRRGEKNSTQKIEGHKVIYYYYFDSSVGKPVPSPLQIKRNYQNAAVKLGGKILFDHDSTYNTTTLVIAKNGQETWAEIKSGNGATYYLTIVDRQTMGQDVTANADAMKEGLAQTGHVEVSGIFFDFNKANLKPESKTALDELTKLLKTNSSLRVWVVGHTDNVGPVEANLILSKNRAAAVVAALKAAGIASSRMAPFGNGPYAPVAANTAEEGRAKNRRVELVAQP